VRSEEMAKEEIVREGRGIEVRTSSDSPSNNHVNNREKCCFYIKDCALVSISTGKKAYSLAELLDQLRGIHPGSIYHHFWSRLLRPSFDHPEFHNDFAAWAHHDIHDETLAERLNIIDPQDFNTLEDLRQELIDNIEERMDESEFLPWAKAKAPFYFVRSQIVVLDTGRRIYHPEELAQAVASMSLGSIFYHFIDARRRTDMGVDDFRAWLIPMGKYSDVVESLANIDPYFTTLSELKEELVILFSKYFKTGVNL